MKKYTKEELKSVVRGLWSNDHRSSLPSLVERAAMEGIVHALGSDVTAGEVRSNPAMNFYVAIG